jgi:hypothetical protein
MALTQLEKAHASERARRMVPTSGASVSPADRASPGVSALGGNATHATVSNASTDLVTARFAWSLAWNLNRSSTCGVTPSMLPLLHFPVPESAAGMGRTELARACKSLRCQSPRVEARLLDNQLIDQRTSRWVWTTHAVVLGASASDNETPGRIIETLRRCADCCCPPRLNHGGWIDMSAYGIILG